MSYAYLFKYIIIGDTGEQILKFSFSLFSRNFSIDFSLDLRCRQEIFIKLLKICDSNSNESSLIAIYLLFDHKFRLN